MRQLPSRLQGTRGRVHAGLHSTLGLGSTTVSGKDTGPLGSRCSEPQPPSSFLSWIQCRLSHLSGEHRERGYLGRRVSWTPLSLGAPRDAWQRRKAGPEEGRAALPVQAQAQPGWLRIKEPEPSFSAFRSYLRRLSGAARPPTAPLQCPLFLPSGGWGVGVTSAQFGDGDVEKILPIRFPQSPFLSVSLLLSLTLSPLDSGGGGGEIQQILAQ